MAGAGYMTMTISNIMLQFFSAWSIEIIVLSSFILQAVLSLLAGIRRRSASGLLRGIVWLSYQLADYSATYGLGHLSVGAVTASPKRQQLVAFWAPFLLLHLGGPDSITAYALEDNKLWKRQLFVNFIPQVLSTAYVLYKTIPRSSRLLFVAAWLMFSVGVVKYGERIWALHGGNLGSIRKAVEKQPQDEDDRRRVIRTSTGDPEYALFYAHSQLHVCKRALVDSSSEEVYTSEPVDTIFLDDRGKFEDWKKTWMVFQMELSLLYDILYTKAAMIHTWHGYCIRVFSLLVSAIALLLFLLSGSGGGAGGDQGNLRAMRVDIAITYTLLAGAIILDTWSLLSAAGSSWAYAFLTTRMPRQRHIVERRWRQLRRRLVKKDSSSTRRFSGSIGQHNVLRFCTRDSKWTDIWYKLAKGMGVEWCTKGNRYSTEMIPDDIMNLVFEKLLELLRITEKPHKQGRQHIRRTEYKSAAVNSAGLLKAERGQGALTKYGLQALEQFIREEIHEQILIWHIATDIYLIKSRQKGKTVDAIKLISNYMAFLLAKRPHMLPGLVLRKLYNITCSHLTVLVGGKEPVNDVVEENNRKDIRYESLGSALPLARELARELMSMHQVPAVQVDFVFNVWVEILLYVSHRCSRESHAEQLSKGSELTTVVWLMAERAAKFYIEKEIYQADD